jgi:hypothetical protein
MFSSMDGESLGLEGNLLLSISTSRLVMGVGFQPVVTGHMPMEEDLAHPVTE